MSATMSWPKWWNIYLGPTRYIHKTVNWQVMKASMWSVGHLVKAYRNSLPVPKITKTPGQFEGAKLCFKDVLELRLAEVVS